MLSAGQASFGKFFLLAHKKTTISMHVIYYICTHTTVNTRVRKTWKNMKLHQHRHRPQIACLISKHIYSTSNPQLRSFSVLFIPKDLPPYILTATKTAPKDPTLAPSASLTATKTETKTAPKQHLKRHLKQHPKTAPKDPIVLPSTSLMRSKNTPSSYH